MTPGHIKGANRYLGAPDNWDPAKDGTCETLPIRDDGKLLESAWVPTADELAALNRGAPVILTIWGRSHPVVSVNVEGLG